MNYPMVKSGRSAKKSAIRSSSGAACGDTEEQEVEEPERHDAILRSLALGDELQVSAHRWRSRYRHATAGPTDISRATVPVRATSSRCTGSSCRYEQRWAPAARNSGRRNDRTPTVKDPPCPHPKNPSLPRTY